MIRFQPILRATIALALVLAGLPGIIGNVHAEALPLISPLRIELDDPSGIVAYRITNPVANLSVEGTFYGGGDLNEWQPVRWSFVFPDGTILSRQFAGDIDNSKWLAGRVAYAGARHLTVSTPGVSSMDVDYVRGIYENYDVQEGWLVITWHAQSRPIVFDMNWTAATTFEKIEGHGVQAFMMRDYKEGVRAGAPAAVAVNVNDGARMLSHGLQMFGYLSYVRTGTAGIGNLTFDLDEAFHKELDLTHIYDPDSYCVCPAESGLWLFTGNWSVDVKLNYVGEGRLTQIFLVVGFLPAGTLPENLWTEHVEPFVPPDG